MSALTYQGVASADISGFRLPPMNDPTITGTTVDADPLAPILTFTLLQKVNNETTQATIQATISPLGWSTTPAQLDIAPTFVINSTSTVIAAKMVITTINSPTASDSGESVSSTGSSKTSSTLNGSTTSSSTTNGPSTTSSISNGYTSGELAGVAVGCLIAGLLIASLIAFLFLRRRTRSRTPRYSLRNNARTSEVDGESFVLATGSKKTWQKHLPQPESDQTISRLSNRTLDDIELLVENFYVDQPMKQTDGTDASDISLFSSPYLGRPLVDIIQTSHSPTVLLKHCIAYYLLLKIDPTHNDSTSLLPREFVVPAKGDHQILSQLRVLMAQSRSNFDQDEQYLMQRDRAAQAIVQQIERAFQPWARGTPQDRAKNLKGILIHLCELGNTLFSQPAIFEWRWGENRALSQGQIVMLPGLDKTTDSQAVSLATPICLVKPRLGNFVN